jgi:O-antigen/teichoic acid export membrane protein
VKKLSTRQNFLWNTFGCLTYLGCQWLLTVIVVVASNDYTNSGIFAFVMATGVIYSSLGLFGVRPYQVSDLQEQFTSQNYIAFRLITNASSLVIFYVYTFLITSDSSIILASIIYLIFKFDESFSDVIYGIYQLNERMDFIGISQILRGFISLLAFTFPLYLTKDLNLAILCMFIGCFLVTLIYDLPHAKKFGEIKPKISISKTKSLFRACFFSMFSTMLIGLIATTVRQIYGITQGNYQLGIYAAIATPAVIIQVAVIYLYSPLLGKFATARDDGCAIYKRYFFKILGLILLAIIVMIVILSLLGIKVFPIIYGESITEDITILPWVLVATGCLGLLYYLMDNFIVLRKRPISLTTSGLGFLVSLITSFFFIQEAGMNGINLSIIAGCLTASIIGLVFIVKLRN